MRNLRKTDVKGLLCVDRTVIPQNQKARNPQILKSSLSWNSAASLGGQDSTWGISKMRA